MPFKTKRQKLAAAQRRFTFSQSGSVIYKADDTFNPSDSAEQSSAKGVQKAHVAQVENLVYIKRDLLRILAIASFIIIAQLAISLTLP